MNNENYYMAYETRYQKAYEAGAEFWGHDPDDKELIDVLTDWVNNNNLKGKRIIEFACGEGASGVIFSKLGCIYHGVDISPTVVNKAKNLLKDYPNAKVKQLNMVSQKLDETYDAALDVMGFHMLVTDPDRENYLKNVFSCLKNCAPMFFFRELYDEDADETYINSFDEWLSVTNNDYTVPRKMYFKKDDQDVEIQIPYVPGRSKTKDGYMREITNAEFIVDSIVEMPESRKVIKSVSIHVHKYGCT